MTKKDFLKITNLHQTLECNLFWEVRKSLKHMFMLWDQRQFEVTYKLFETSYLTYLSLKIKNDHNISWKSLIYYKGSNATLKSHRPIVYALHSIHQQHSTRVLFSVRSLNKRLTSCFKSVQSKQSELWCSRHFSRITCWKEKTEVHITL